LRLILGAAKCGSSKLNTDKKKIKFEYLSFIYWATKYKNKYLSTYVSLLM